MLCAIDWLLEHSAAPWKSRSDLARHALQAFLREQDRSRQEAHEAVVFRANRERLAVEARALIAEQAEP